MRASKTGFPSRVAGLEVNPKVIVLNGWAASPHAWDLCTFPREAVFSYTSQLAGEVDRFIDAAPVDERFTLVGWSMGGASALRLACRQPERIAKLVLIAATPRMMEDKANGWRGLSLRRLEALHQSIRLTRGAGFFGLPSGKPNPFMVDCEENLMRGIEFLRSTDLRAELEKIFAPAECPWRFPVHIFHSERDGVVRPENASYLKRIFPQARLVMVPGTEHALPVFIPELIDEVVRTS